MGTLLKDLRFAARTLWKDRAVTAVALAALALLADLVPAPRAMRVDLLVALRYE